MYVPTIVPAPTNPVSQHQRERAAADRQHRQRRIKAAREAYHGNAPDLLKPTVTKAGQRFDDNVKLNFARVIVDVGVDFLFGHGFERQIAEDAETPEEVWLTDCWAANREATFLTKLAQEGAVTGHAFVKLLPADPAAGREYPRPIVLSTENVWVDTDEEDVETAVRYTIQWTAMRGAVEVARRQTIEPAGRGWVTRDEESVGDVSSWALLREEAWPHPWPPIVDCQNLVCAGEYYGVADLEPDILRLNNAVNYLQSNAMRVHRFNGHPVRWARGVTGADKLDLDPDKIIGLTGMDASLNLLQWSGDAGMRAQMYEELVDALMQMARVPRVAAGKVDNIGALSGTALRILFQPLLAKTTTKRATYGGLLDELDQRLLELGQFERQPGLHRNWPDVLPTDLLEQAQAYTAHLTMGVVSKATVSANLGYDWPIESARIERESLGLPEDASDAEVEAARAERDANLVAAQAAAEAQRGAQPGAGDPQRPAARESASPGRTGP